MVLRIYWYVFFESDIVNIGSIVKKVLEDYKISVFYKSCDYFIVVEYGV